MKQTFELSNDETKQAIADFITKKTGISIKSSQVDINIKTRTVGHQMNSHEESFLAITVGVING